MASRSDVVSVDALWDVFDDARSFAWKDHENSKVGSGMTYPELAQAAKCIRERLEMYEKTGNREWLVDIANFAMIEYRFPSHPQAHFRATDSRESPGLAGGISYKELMEDTNG